MRIFSVPLKDEGKRVDRFIENKLPGLPFSLLLKTFRKRDVKVNGTRIKENHILSAGDTVELYISEDIFSSFQKDLPIPIIFEDKNILVINKPQGIPVQSDREHSVEKRMKELFSTGDCYTMPGKYPALCHRLDRNTGGLLLLAKNSAALEVLLKKFKTRELTKKYCCVVSGCPKKPYAELHSYLWKDSKNSIVKIYDRKVKGSLPIQTNYSILETIGSLSLLEVELVTGRTHQIRAHLAHIGHPVLGDGKYGKNSINRKYGFNKQLLWSSFLQFSFTTDASVLNYLKGRSFSLPYKSLKTVMNKKII